MKLNHLHFFLLHAFPISVGDTGGCEPRLNRCPRGSPYRDLEARARGATSTLDLPGLCRHAVTAHILWQQPRGRIQSLSTDLTTSRGEGGEGCKPLDTHRPGLLGTAAGMRSRGGGARRPAQGRLDAAALERRKRLLDSVGEVGHLVEIGLDLLAKLRHLGNHRLRVVGLRDGVDSSAA